VSGLASQPLGEFLAQVAAKSPTPGGGATASAAGALASALGEMVVAYSRGKRSLAAHESHLAGVATRLKRARQVLLRLAEEDAHAYGLLAELLKLDEGDERRQRELPAAIELSIAAPRAMIAACADVARALESLIDRSNTRLASDLAVSAVLCEASARAALWNVRVNLPLLPEAQRPPLTSETGAMLRDISDRTERIERWAREAA